MSIDYLCSEQEKEAVQNNTFVYRYDENPPTPYIYKISPYGEVKIRFNTTMEPKDSLNATET